MSRRTTTTAVQLVATRVFQVATCVAAFVGMVTTDTAKKTRITAPENLMAATDGHGHVLVYNRVGKAGSTTMLGLLAQLAVVHSFELANDQHFTPPKAYVEGKLDELARAEGRSAYINHCGFVGNTQATWINVVREPIDRLASIYYYHVDPVARIRDAARHELQQRMRDPRCGCAFLEFDECIRIRHERGCTLQLRRMWTMQPQMGVFCDSAPADCTLEAATRNVREHYALVGLSSQMSLTVQTMEAMLPRWFSNASAILTSSATTDKNQGAVVPSAMRNRVLYSRAGSSHNRLTNTSMLGSVSKTARKILSEVSDVAAAEIAFYKYVERLFWLRSSRALGEAMVPQVTGL